MKRYTTRWYTTTLESEVERLCAIDHTEEVRVTDGVEPLHVHADWVLWSDYRLSRRCPELPLGGTLGRGAVEIICAVREGGSIEGGYATVLDIDRVVDKRVTESRMTSLLGMGRYSEETWTLTMKDGSTRNLYIVAAGNEDSVMFEAFWSRQKMREFVESLTPPSTRVRPDAACHYCGMPAVKYGWFDEPVCAECG